MLPQSFPSYSYSSDQRWTSENARPTLCCAVLHNVTARSNLCNTLSYSLTGKWPTIFPPSPASPSPCGAPHNGRTSTPPSRPPFAFLMAVRQSGTPCHQSAWFADINSPWTLPSAPRRLAPHALPGGGANSSDRVDRVWFCSVFPK